MVGANAGGGTDIIARMLAEKMGEGLKGSFVVENKPGASNTIAADLTAKAPADGYTLLVATNTGQAIAPHLMKLNFDPIKDLAPVGLVVTVPNVLVVGPTVTATNVKELVAQMKAKPDDFKYGSSGIGSTQHIAGEGFNLAAGVKSVHIPYKGSSQAHLDLIAGNIQMMFDTTSSAMGQIKAGKFRPLALTTATRSAELPQVPTLAEAGVSGFEMSTWYALFVTGGTPPRRPGQAAGRTGPCAEAAGRAGQAQGPGWRARCNQRRSVRADEPAGVRPFRHPDQAGRHQAGVSARRTHWKGASISTPSANAASHWVRDSGAKRKVGASAGSAVTSSNASSVPPMTHSGHRRQRR